MLVIQIPFGSPDVFICRSRFATIVVALVGPHSEAEKIVISHTLVACNLLSPQLRGLLGVQLMILFDTLVLLRLSKWILQGFHSMTWIGKAST